MVLRKFKKKLSGIFGNKKSFKERLYINQNENLINVTGFTNNKYSVTHLILEERESGLTFNTAVKYHKGKFECTLNLYDLNRELFYGEQVFDMFLKINVDAST